MIYEGCIENTEDIDKEMLNHTEGINKSACHALGMCKGCKVSHPKSCYTPKCGLINGFLNQYTKLVQFTIKANVNM